MPRPTQKSRRARRRIEVRYGPGEPTILGYSGNVSATGMMVRTLRVFAPGTVLELEIKGPAGTCRLKGEVVWAREGPAVWLHTGRIGMGINFIQPPGDLLETIGAAA